MSQNQQGAAAKALNNSLSTGKIDQGGDDGIALNVIHANNGASRGSEVIDSVANGAHNKEVIENVKKDILGQDPPTGFRKFFYSIDVWSGEQLVRAPKSYNVVNAYFTMIYYLIFIAFSIYSLYNFVHQVPVETNTMVKSISIQSIYIRVNMTCNIAYGCGNWSTTSSPNLLNPIQIVANWAKPGTDCSQNPAKTVYNIPVAEGPTMQYLGDFTVCYSQSSSDMVQIVVPYSNNYLDTNPMYNIQISGSPDKYNNDMYFEVLLRPLEWKTVYFSQTEYVDVKSDTTYEPYIADLFYNGHSTDNNIAKLTFKVQQFSYSSAKTKVISIYSALGSIGGFSWTCSSLLGAVKNIGVGMGQFIVDWKNSDSATLVSFFTMLYVFILKALGQLA